MSRMISVDGLVHALSSEYMTGKSSGGTCKRPRVVRKCYRYRNADN